MDLGVVFPKGITVGLGIFKQGGCCLQSSFDRRDQSPSLHSIGKHIKLRGQLSGKFGLMQLRGPLKGVIGQHYSRGNLKPSKPGGGRGKGDQVMVFLLHHGVLDLVLGSLQLIGQGFPIVIVSKLHQAIPPPKQALADTQRLGQGHHLTTDILYLLTILSLHRDVAVGCQHPDGKG